MIKKKKSAIAMVIVLFFAFAVGVALSMVIRANTTIFSQNKNTLRQLQAYYLAWSGLNHALMKIRLLPRETYAALKSTGINSFSDIDNTTQQQLCFYGPGEKSYDLFDYNSCPDATSPFVGDYQLNKISLEGSHEGKSFAQDSYHIEVSSTVFPYTNNTNVKSTDLIAEDVIISRFSSSEGE
ncbi:MAG: hypothetical protein HQM08_04185 [Candidatus Riflebacteria bacterium]|nr:hypothetical protein [Candidatus Riflebacteria bacterium]